MQCKFSQINVNCRHQVSLRFSNENCVDIDCFSIQKQPSKAFCEKNLSQKFRKIHRKAPVLKKETLAQMFPCEFCEISKNISFIEHLLETTCI